MKLQGIASFKINLGKETLVLGHVIILYGSSFSLEAGILIAGWILLGTEIFLIALITEKLFIVGLLEEDLPLGSFVSHLGAESRRDTIITLMF